MVHFFDYLFRAPLHRLMDPHPCQEACPLHIGSPCHGIGRLSSAIRDYLVEQFIDPKHELMKDHDSFSLPVPPLLPPTVSLKNESFERRHPTEPVNGGILPPLSNHQMLSLCSKSGESVKGH